VATPNLHFAQFLVHGPTWHSHGMWRHPRTEFGDNAWARPELYQHIARTCERGLFDMVFFADLNYISDTFTGSLDPALRYAVQAPEHDPIPLLSFMAAVTEHVGLASTFSTSNQHPFYVARLFATLDHLTRGRVGWNVVTSLNHNQQANSGAVREDTDLRYDKAHEFIEVCQRLWDSWDADAVVMDAAAPQFADSGKVRRIDFEGEWFASRGPLNVTRSPFGGPAILQAGASPKGRDFAARHADAIAHAVELQHEHNELVPLEAGMAILSAHLDFDLAQLDPDEPMAERDDPELQRMRTRYLRPDGSSYTVAEVAQRHGQSVGLPQIVGTPTTVADQLEAFAAEAGGDGFMLSPIWAPGGIDDFVDLVIPELQRRGTARPDYTGTTIRDHLHQTW